MVLGALVAVHVSADAGLTFACKPDNDLYRALSASGAPVGRYDTAGAAIEHAREGSGVLILSGPPDDLVAARSKHLKLYIEQTPDGKVKNIEWERVVVIRDAFGPDLPKDRILSIGRQAIVDSKADSPLLVVGRVAGFDHLAFGMPKEIWPLLWIQDPETMVAAAPLSNFATARYSPGKAWLPVWRTIIDWLGSPRLAASLKWEPSVRPSYSKGQSLPKDAEGAAMKRAAAWFMRAHLLLKDSDKTAYAEADRWSDRVGPAPTGNGDGTQGMLEGYSSAIDTRGNQPVRWYRRSDCNGESAMALALAGDSNQRKVGWNLAEWVANVSSAQHKDPSETSYGLAGWNDLPANRGYFWGDDNARYILGLIGASGALHENRWDDAILRCILANFRTSGTEGFRGNMLTQTDLDKNGWRHYFDSATVNMAPHFEAYIWACYLWAYSKTHYQPLLTRTEKGIRRTMEAGENAWTWTNGSQQERARMLLPLSWLVRVEDTAEHRKWLDDMVRKVIAYQDPCGAIREEFGDLSHGIAGPPRSNEAYGTAETPMIQENGDPLADMLYTSNFAFLGLHEAAQATHNPAYGIAEEKLADFLCRIQIRSETHPELNGAWFRAFDFGDWDYWASNADLGWGAWSIETGWSVSWITSVLALRHRHESLWTVDARFKPNMSLIGSMLPDSQRTVD